MFNMLLKEILNHGEVSVMTGISVNPGKKGGRFCVNYFDLTELHYVVTQDSQLAKSVARYGPFKACIFMHERMYVLLL